MGFHSDVADYREDLNVGKWTIKGICKYEVELNLFQMAKCELGMSKSTKITNALKK